MHFYCLVPWVLSSVHTLIRIWHGNLVFTLSVTYLSAGHFRCIIWYGSNNFHLFLNQLKIPSLTDPQNDSSRVPKFSNFFSDSSKGLSLEMAWINSPNCLEASTAGGLLFFPLLRRSLSQIIVSCPSGLRKLWQSNHQWRPLCYPYKRIAVFNAQLKHFKWLSTTLQQTVERRFVATCNKPYSPAAIKLPFAIYVEKFLHYL